jgi:CubicO group peptidase (beta-lactamase class C family)
MRTRRSSVHAVLTVLATALPTPAQEPPEAKPIAAALQPFVDKNTLAGAVALVAGPDKTLALEAVGYADLAGKRPMRTDSLFWIASMSKPMTAAAVMILADEGKLDLDDPVEKYLPEFKGQWLAVERDESHVLLKRPKRPVAIRDLLTHTSGLLHFLDVEAPGSKQFELLPLKEAARYYALTPLLSEPGSTWRYSNAGMNTAGRIVEVVSGVPFEEFMSRRLFEPLGMRDTTFSPGKQQLDRLAKSYQPNPAGTGLEEAMIPILKYPPDGRKYPPLPAGGLYSTADDLGRFCRMLLNGGESGGRRVLSKAAVEQMTGKYAQTPEGQGVGLGWFLGSGGTYGHSGAYNTRMELDPKTGLAKVLLTQHVSFQGGSEKVFAAFDKLVTERYKWGSGRTPK